MRVLFSPLGLSRGGLFTAIVHTKPDRVVAITSLQAAGGVDEITQRAREHTGRNFSYEVHTLSDPFTGFIEGRELAKKLAARQSEENIVNITGGRRRCRIACKPFTKDVTRASCLWVRLR